ncbi:hypothetical protein PQ478_08705 [Alkalihalophilus pseudofirmus]|uniref:hypothetical protein n=1 Tax=Alkalihalophilus pseudofirmus TaxID=79885 RepID=UPI00259BD35F|nr:hypothetical protein [Alkalihalophilus pseudofirmus]WEG18549.1 hypothetical protein PQ478_08705 [Alkalihalophilus pseudofirmus]
MAKITKKEYNRRKQLILDEIKNQNELLESYEKAANEDFEKAHAEIGDKWNEAHDKIYDLEKELKFLDDEWDKRNWSHQDHTEWELITNNID